LAHREFHRVLPATSLEGTSMKFLLRAGSTLLLSAAACASQAANVTLTGWAFGAGNNVQATGYSGKAGAYVGRLTGAPGFDADPFVTYCVELEEYFSFSGNAMTGYNVVDGASYFAARRGDGGIAERLGRLMSFVAANPAAVDNAAESTSLQLAVWNLVYDSDWAVSTASTFRDQSSYRTAADSLLAGGQGIAASRFDVFVLEKRGSQDFVLLRQRVPEPGTLALVAAAFGALAWRRRRG
jgi:hypothetical protein